MTKSQRRTIARLKMLQELRLEPLKAEIARLLSEWSNQAWRRVRDKSQPPASELIDIASRYGLRKEMELIVISAVQCERCGPSFLGCSVVFPGNGGHPDVVRKINTHYRSRGKRNRF